MKYKKQRANVEPIQSNDDTLILEEYKIKNYLIVYLFIFIA